MALHVERDRWERLCELDVEGWACKKISYIYHLTFGLTESTRAIVATGTRLCPDNAADGTGKGKYTQVGQGESHG